MGDCATCRYCAQVEVPASAGVVSLGNARPSQLQCRRYPPQLVTVAGGLAALFPVVDTGMSCGEYQAHPQIAN